MVSLGLNDRVTLHGAGLDVSTFLADLDVFVLSSVDEGLPIVLQEAMAAGLPIVSTRLPGFSEIAPSERVAWYCRPGQPDELSELMLRVALRPDLAEIGAEARRLAGNFGIQETCRQYRELFEALVAKRRLGWIISRRCSPKCANVLDKD